VRILFLSHYFPPEVNAPASRTWEHCREWTRLGAAVEVITCVPNHPQGRAYPGYRNRLWQRETLEGVELLRVWTCLSPNEGFLRRSLNYLSYMFSAVIAALFVPRPDVVISTSPQFFNGLAGYFVSRLRGVPWILEIRDLWPESIVTVGAIRNRALIGMLRRLELFAYRKADRIVVVTDAFAAHIGRLGIERDRIDVIKNGVKLAFFKSRPAEVESLKAELGIEGRFVVSYFGTHGMAHKLETVLEAAECLREDKGIAFLLAGDGAERRRLVETRRRLRLGNVIMLEQQPKERMPALWDLSDVTIVLLRKSPLFRTVIPSKIFEAMAMEKPILLGVEGESRTIIEAAEAGLPFEPESAEQLAQCIIVLRDSPVLRKLMGQAGRAYVSAHHDRTVLAARFLAIARRAGGVSSASQTEAA
jgi:glycosyltransferase involved in cell wall biosynthesis